MTNTLIIRYHRIGDALTVLPLVASLATKYKDDHFTVLTNDRFEDLFKMMPSNVTYLPMVTKKTKGTFRSISFIIRRQLFTWKMGALIKSIDKVALLQNDIIEEKFKKILDEKKIQYSIIDVSKFLSDERVLNKCNDGLTMIGLHQKTLAEIGYTDIQPTFDPSPVKNKNATALFSRLGIDANKKLIAISPFSKEVTKIYPMPKMEKVIAYFSEKKEYQVLIFGGGIREEKQVNSWIEKYPSVISLIGKVPFSDEAAIMAKCNVALTMDSANLHLAALVNTPVVSIWGATIPKNGYFPPSGAKLEDAMVLNIACQPCSIFGNKPCTNPHLYACLEIDPMNIIKKIENIIINQDNNKQL